MFDVVHFFKLFQGDSGSPIVIKSASGVWTQVAIVSFGLGIYQSRN